MARRDDLVERAVPTARPPVVALLLVTDVPAVTLWLPDLLGA